MTCPPEIATILLDILCYGILRIRNTRWDGRGGELVAEADHIHNLPGIIGNYSPDRLAYYWEFERPSYLRTMPDVPGPCKALWDELRPYVEGASH